MTAPTKPVLDGLAFAEGLRWHEDRLWFSDMHGSAVHFWDQDGGALGTIQIDGTPSGLGWTTDGDLLVVSMIDRKLLGIDADGTERTVADLGRYTPQPINDMTVDREGRAYISTFGFDFHGGGDFTPGAILRVDPDGSHRIAADELLFPNGMVITDLGRTLVVAETFGGRLTAFTRAADGSLTDRRLWAQLPEGVWPDGICLDADGAIWVASPETSECLRVVEDGAVVDRVHVPGRLVVTCALGGSEGRTLFLATSEHLAPAEARKHRSGRIEITVTEIEAQ